MKITIILLSIILLQLILIFIRKINFIKILYILGFMQILNEIDKSSIGNETTNFYKQNPVLNGYHIVSELGDILRSS